MDRSEPTEPHGERKKKTHVVFLLQRFGIFVAFSRFLAAAICPEMFEGIRRLYRPPTVVGRGCVLIYLSRDGCKISLWNDMDGCQRRSGDAAGRLPLRELGLTPHCHGRSFRNCFGSLNR